MIWKLTIPICEMLDCSIEGLVRILNGYNLKRFRLPSLKLSMISFRWIRSRSIPLSGISLVNMIAFRMVIIF